VSRRTREWPDWVGLMARLAIKRIQEPASPDDGYRILVDRLWPRGISKEYAAVDEWAKDVAPSNELRTWFGHRDDRFAEFADRYRGRTAGVARPQGPASHAAPPRQSYVALLRPKTRG
jgi:Protein of unknown function, DUF488